MVLSIDSMSCRSMLAICSGETTKRARSSVVRIRGGRFGLGCAAVVDCGVACACVPAPDRVPPAGPLDGALGLVDCAAGNVGLRGEGASKV
eukprot:5155590-Pleurochrysis_carterae.AAC.1